MTASPRQGDELLPDELNFVRVQMTARHLVRPAPMGAPMGAPGRNRWSHDTCHIHMKYCIFRVHIKYIQMH